MNPKERQYRDQRQQALYQSLKDAGHDPDTAINDLRSKGCSPQMGVIYFIVLSWLFEGSERAPELDFIEAGFEISPIDGREQIVLKIKR